MAFDDKTERTEVSAVPLYQQVMDDLKGEIARGVYASGSRIPSEMELAKYYGVGRITVRRAVELSRAGYLNRQQGRGTFVCAPKLKRKIVQKGDVQSFSEGCAANDMVPGACLVSRTVVAATREDAAFFGVEPGCELIVVERVRTADGVPVMLENNAFVLIDHPYLQTLADEDLTDNSIFAFVAEHSGRAPLKSDPCTVEIALADAQTAPLLEVPVGEPLFYMEAYFTDEDERPLLLGRQKIVGSRYVFDI
ncbi:MAG: GntR family transcriptional regulator [Collinsella aerofaciens]